MGKGPKDWESAKEAVVSLEDCLENRVGDWMDSWMEFLGPRKRRSGV